MKSLDPHMLSAPCFPQNIVAGISYKSFFTPAYAKHTGSAFKAALATALQMRCGMSPHLLTQVHGVRVVPHVPEQAETQSSMHVQALPYAEADGHYTMQANVCLGVLVADCAGVLLHDPSTGYAAALHSGWKGTAQNIVGMCIKKAHAQGVACVKSLIAWISPCARGCCYEVGKEVSEHFVSAYPRACVYNERTKKYTLDLARVIQAQLSASGLLPNNVHTAPLCSICSKSFHSHRREGAASGRCLVFIMRRA